MLTTDERRPPSHLDLSDAQTLPETLRHWSRRTPNRTALVHGEHSLSYAQLSSAAEAAVAGLMSRGVQSGDCVVLVGDNSVEWVVAYLATLRLGAVVSPANNRLNPSQFREQCDVLDAGLVLYDEAHADLARAGGRPVADVAELSSGCEDAVADLPWPAPEAEALVSFTSGTTGAPKGAVLTHDALFQGSHVWPTYLGTGRSDSTLVLVPLFHNTGFVDQLGHMLIAGGATHLLGRYKTAEAIAELAARPVTFLTAVPSILRLLTVAKDADSAFAHARIVEFGGSPMPEAWSAEIHRRWPAIQLIHGYGLSEFTSVCTFLPHDLVLVKGESVGRAAPGVDLQITRVDGAAAQTDEVGEIWVKGATRMLRYWGQPELTAQKFAGDWLRTGDLGRVDSDGLLWLTGRVDDVINRGGEKVLPAFVESRIAELPEVAEACVFGFDDPILQQRVAAAIQVRPGFTFAQDEAVERLRSTLPDYAVPERWFQYDELPRTASGKTDRRAIHRNFELEED